MIYGCSRPNAWEQCFGAAAGKFQGHVSTGARRHQHPPFFIVDFGVPREASLLEVPREEKIDVLQHAPSGNPCVHANRFVPEHLMCVPRSEGFTLVAGLGSGPAAGVGDVETAQKLSRFESLG